MILQREELMISLNHDSIPTLRNANFRKPTKTQQFPKKPPYFTPNPNIFDDLKGKIKFKGIKSPRDSWKLWVENLEKTHERIWKKVGIFDAIKASTYKINKDVMLIMYLGQKWCVETNTFVFPWGECSITLEDVMILGCFSVLGESVFSCFRHSSAEELAMKEMFESCCTAIKRANFGNLSLDKWVKYFEGMGGDLEHVACLVLWLSRYVFCTDSVHNDTDVFALAFRLAKGTKIALGCGVLACIYRDLRLLKGRIVALNNGDADHGSSLDLDLWSLLQLVQIWAWERFRTVSPKPLCLVRGQPRIARWHNVRTLKNDSSSSRLDEDFANEELFLWRPYGLCLENWDFPKFYVDEEMWVVINSDVDEEFLSFVKCLRDCRLEGVDCVEWYLPHRVGMQFGLDQDVPDYVHRKNPDLELEVGIRCYVPPRLLEGDVTVRYLKWWKGASTSCDNEVLIACPSLKTHCRELNILFKGTRPQDYPSRTCNDAMQVDSVSRKEILTTELALVENLASQSHVSLVPDSVVKDGKINEHIPITNEKPDCFETNHTHISSLLVVNDAVIVDKLLPGSETDVFTELVERVCGDMEDTINKIPLSSFIDFNTPICEGLDRSAGEIGEENSTSEYEDANRIHKACDDDAVNEAMQVDSVSCNEILKTDLAPVENLASQSLVSLVPHSPDEDGKTSEHIPITNEKSNCVGINQTHICSSSAEAVIVNKLIPGLETDKFTELVERVCGDMENTNNKIPLSSSIPCNTPICTGLDRGTRETGEEHPPLEYDEANRIHEAPDDVVMVDIDETSDDENDNPLESLCKKLEERLSLLETKVATLMAAKSESK